MEKKPYAPPTVTQHGDAIRQTRGFGGSYWELYNPQSMPVAPPPPPKDDD